MKTSPPVVLVVHPEGEARTSLYALLAAEGHPVATVSRGLEALDYVFKHRPGVVVASTRLSDISLKKFLQYLDRAELGACTVLLAGPEDRESAGALEGSMQVLRWPAAKSEVPAAVDRCLHEACL